MSRLTDVRLEIGLDDDDNSKIGLTVMGNIRDDEDRLISQYHRDISDELTPQMQNALNQISTRIVDRILRDHSLTRGDMDAGKQKHAERQAAREADIEEGSRSRREYDTAHMETWEVAAAEAKARFDTIKDDEDSARDAAEVLAEQIRQDGEAAQQAPEETPA